MFHMTNDSRLFKTKAELESQDFYPVAGNRWRRGDDEYVPLYEGKMVQMYDHRAASVIVNPNNLHRPGQPEPATLDQHQDSDWLPCPQYWVPLADVRRHLQADWAMCFKEITAPTNRRTMIASLGPLAGYGNKVPLLQHGPATKTAHWVRAVPRMLANLNSFIFDFVARQKLHGQTLNLFIFEQLPVVPLERFEEQIAGQVISDRVRGEVLRLTFTSTDLAGFAHDLGFEGGPYRWDEEGHRHTMARLDALFSRLYGLDLDDASYVLDQFPIVRADDERSFGRFETRDLVLAYMRALDAGDLTSRVSL